MRLTIPLVLAALLACLGTLVLSGPVRAECPYFVIPPAPEAARSAREVIVGTVVENVGDQLYDFRLRIDHVLRGPAKVGDIRRFTSLYPGWPFARDGNGKVILTDEGKPFAPCEPIPWKGDVIALSLDAVAPNGKTRYNAASWISGDLPINRDLPRTTLAEMRRLAEMPQTDTSPMQVPVGRGTTIPVAACIVLAAFVLAGIAGLRGRRRPRSGDSRPRRFTDRL
jgi:hypothetical protein